MCRSIKKKGSGQACCAGMAVGGLQLLPTLQLRAWGPWLQQPQPAALINSAVLVWGWRQSLQFAWAAQAAVRGLGHVGTGAGCVGVTTRCARRHRSALGSLHWPYHRVPVRIVPQSRASTTTSWPEIKKTLQGILTKKLQFVQIR